MFFKFLHNNSKFLKRCFSVLLAGNILYASFATTSAFDTSYFSNRVAESGEYLYTQLSADEQAVYNSILNQIDELKIDDKDPSGVEIIVPQNASPNMEKVLFAILRDHPEFFWIDFSKLVWEQNKNDSQGNPIYNLSCKVLGETFFYEGFTIDNLQSYIDDLNAKVSEIKSSISQSDDVSKLKEINNWISKNNVYNASGLGATNFSRCAASGLLSDNDVSTTNDDPVCYGYATAMKVLLDAFGIENAYIEGWAYNTGNRPAGEQHAWNYVHIDDGTGSKQWYAIDPTWDDPKLSILPARQHYFLVGQNTITEKGFVNYEMFKQNHNSSSDKSPAYKYGFSYPTLSMDACNPSASGNVLVMDIDGNTSGYDTLEAAVNAAKSGDTLILQNTITLDKTVTINKDITIDLNGQFTMSSNPVAISSSTAPVFNINSNNSVSIINSGVFTSINLTGSSNIITNNGSLILGSNVKLSSNTISMSGSVISGNEPILSKNSRIYRTNKLLTVYLVAEPKQPQNGQFPATNSDTIQDLLNSYSKPSITPQYYNEQGSLSDISNSDELNWVLKQSPNGGNNINPSDSLENGNYRFEAEVFDYIVPYIVEVSGISGGTQQINSISISGLDKPIIGQPFDNDITVETNNVSVSNVNWETNGDITADYGKEYTAVFTLTADSGYSFTDLSNVFVNGENAETSLNSDGTLSVRYTFPAITDITEVSVIGLDEPTTGKPLDIDIDIETSKVSVSDISWLPNDTIANNNTIYTANFTLTAEDECTFSNATKVTINGQPAQTSLISDNTISVSFEFPPTQQKDINLQSIIQPNDIIVPNGTQLNNINLPNEVYIVTDDVNINKASVSWTYEPTDNTTYDPELKTEQAFILKGDVILPDNIYSNNIPLVVKINIIVSAAQVNKTSAPIAQPVQGEYNQNLKVTLSSDTPNATIYYTLDGSEPSALNGKIYNSPIDITGIAGNRVKTVLKAIATSPEHDDSSIVTFTYYISLSGGGSSSGSSSGNTSSGNKTEIVTNPDGSTTTTVTKPDGSKTETTKNPDGSQEVIKTDKDGTVTTTNTDTKGNKTEVIENTDGSSIISINNKDGSSSKTTIDVNNNSKTEVTITKENVTLPIPEVYATTDKNTAPVITVNMPNTSKVEIPVVNADINTVAVIIKSDGTEQIIKNSVITENGISVTLNDGDTVKIINNRKYFYDVSNSFWGAGSVNFVTSREIFNGTGENIFSPNEPMTRYMFVTVLARLNGVDTSTFDKWYEVGTKWAIENNISDGLNMNENLTREQLAVMLYRYCKNPATSGDISGFSDSENVSSWATYAMKWAVENGLISGMDNGSLNSQGKATRAQVATIIQRFISQQ